MKKPFIYLFVYALMVIITTGNPTAQEFKGGTVKYQQTTKYDFAKMFAIKDNARPFVKEWLSKLPKAVKKTKILYFTEKLALFQEDTEEKPVLSKEYRQAMQKAAYVKPPYPELTKVYYDFEKNEKIRQVEFMTRYFRILGPIKNSPWKMTNKRVKVLDYTCMGAEKKKGENSITVWYTPEIPVSVGPGEFYGLPGLILAVEIDGHYAFVARSIDLTPPEKGELSEPGKGKKVTQEEFSKIMKDKRKEWEEQVRAKKGMKKRYSK